MKLKFKSYLFYLVGIIILFQSCSTDFPIPPKIEKCDYTLKKNITVNNIELKAPSSMSSFYYGQLPSDRIFRDLLHPLWQGDFGGTNKAQIDGTLKSSGKNCTGDNTYKYFAGNSRIGQYFLNLDLPKDVPFMGTATMTIRSDDYKSSNDPLLAEYVIWTGSGNDPETLGISGTITGVKKMYRPNTNKLVSASKQLIIGGKLINLP